MDPKGLAPSVASGLRGVPVSLFRHLVPSITQSRPWSVRKLRVTTPRKSSAQIDSFSVAVCTNPRSFFSPCRLADDSILEEKRI